MAILVRKSRWSETSVLATWMTDRFGVLQTSARGALRQGNPLIGKLDLFHRAEISFTLSSKSSLHALREVSLRETFTNPSYAALAVASYFSELTASVAPPMQPSQELHDLLSRALAHLGTQPPTRRAFDYFERETARLLGIWNPQGTTPPQSSLAQLCGKLPRTRDQALDVLQ